MHHHDRQDNTYHGLCYTSRGTLAGTRNSSMGPLHEGSIRRPIALTTIVTYLQEIYRSRISNHWATIGVITPNKIPLTTQEHIFSFFYRSRISNHWATIGVITPNKIPLTTIVTYLQKKLQKPNFKPMGHYRCHHTKSNPIDDHSNISSKKSQKQNFKPLGHYTCMQCGTSHLQTVQENIHSHIILATYRRFTVATVRFTQNVSCNIYIHPIYQQVANVAV